MLPKAEHRDNENTNRPNIIETFGPTRLHTLWYRLAGMLGLRKAAQWKRSRYMRGPEDTVPMSKPFSLTGHELGFFAGGGRSPRSPSTWFRVEVPTAAAISG